MIVGLPPAVALPFIAASLVIHVGYYVALAGAYQHGELGLTYPIMRGFAPLLVALGSSAVLGEVPTLTSWAGILGITLGVALVGLAHPGETLAPPQGTGLRLRQRGDHRGLHLRRRQGCARDGGRRAVRRHLCRCCCSCSTVCRIRLLVWFRRGRAGRPRDPGLRTPALARWPWLVARHRSARMPSRCGPCPCAPIASVAALRETSVLFATLLGVWLLKEKFGLQRGIGTAGHRGRRDGAAIRVAGPPPKRLRRLSQPARISRASFASTSG